MAPLLAICLALSSAGRCGGGTPDDLLDQASRLEDRQDYASAASLLEKAVARDPSSYQLRVSLAEADVHLGRLTRARDQFKAARGLNKRGAQAYIDEGYVDIDAGQQDAAETMFSALIAVDTTNPVGYHHLGMLLDMEGKHAEAKRYLRHAMRLFQKYPKASRARLHCLKDLACLVSGDDPAQAEALFRQALEEGQGLPDFEADVLYFQGTFFQSRGRKREAAAAFKKGLAYCKSQCGDAETQLLAGLAGLHGPPEDPGKKAQRP